MNSKRIICCAAAAGIALTAILSACGNSAATTETEGGVVTVTDPPAETTASASAAEEGTVLNFVPPEIGEEIAVITVKDYGEIKIKLFPDAAPKAVENFKGLINMNYYDELIFHRVIPKFMIQGGDPRGDGFGGHSLWGDKFDGGIPEGLYHFTGAVAYANSGSTATNGSQFYIVNTPDGFMRESCEELMEYDPSRYSWPQNVIDLYHEKGGVPFLDGGYTVFGQVFEGIDIVRAIGDVERDENDKPLKQVQMETIRIEKYEG